MLLLQVTFAKAAIAGGIIILLYFVCGFILSQVILPDEIVLDEHEEAMRKIPKSKITNPSRFS